MNLFHNISIVEVLQDSFYDETASYACIMAQKIWTKDKYDRSSDYSLVHEKKFHVVTTI